MRRAFVAPMLVVILLTAFPHSAAPVRADSPQAIPAERGVLGWRVADGAEPQALSFRLEHGIYYRLPDGILVMGIIKNTGTANLRYVLITVGLFDSPSSDTPVATGQNHTFLWGLRPGEVTPFTIKTPYADPARIVGVGIIQISADETVDEPVEAVMLVNPQRVDSPGQTVVSGKLRNVWPDRVVRLGDYYNGLQRTAANVAFYDDSRELVWIDSSTDQNLNLSPGQECAFATGISYSTDLRIGRWEIWALRGNLDESGYYVQDPYVRFTSTSQRWEGSRYVVDGAVRHLGKGAIGVYTSLVYRDQQGRILNVARQYHFGMQGCEQQTLQHVDSYAPPGFASVEVKAVTETTGWAQAPSQNPPLIAIDVPAENAVVYQPSLVVSGWAISINEGCTPGVDAIDIYVDPADNPLGRRLGPAQYGFHRPDIWDAFGSWYDQSGYRGTFDISGLAPGTYNLYVHAHSLFTGWYYQRRTVRIAPPLASPTPSATPTITRTPTQTPTPTATRPLLPVGYLPVLLKNYVPPTPTGTPTPTVTPTPTATASPTTTATGTWTPTGTSTPTPSETATGTPTVSPSPPSTETATPTETSTEEPAPSETATATETSPATPTDESGPMETSTPTATRTPKNGALPTTTHTPEG